MSRLSSIPKPFDRATDQATLTDSSLAPQQDSLPGQEVHWSDSFKRLVVAIPDASIEETQLAKQIWSLTSVNHADVVLLTLLEDWSRESHIRLQHTLVMQMLATTGVHVTSTIVSDVDWLAALDRMQEPDDALLCFAEHLIVTPHSHGMPVPSKSLSKLAVPLSGLVTEHTSRPVHIVTGLLQPPRRGRNILVNLLSWLGFVAVIVGSFWMQMRLVQLLQDAGSLLRGIVLSASVVLELGLLMLVFRTSR